MARYLWVSLALFLSATSPSWSRRHCYRCDDCENQALTHTTCEEGFDYCLTFQLGKKVTKLCAPEAFCKSESGGQLDLSTKFMNKLKEIFGSFDLSKIMGKDKDDDVDGTKAHCCDYDYCNGSPTRRASFSLLLSILPLALFYLLGY